MRVVPVLSQFNGIPLSTSGTLRNSQSVLYEQNIQLDQLFRWVCHSPWTRNIRTMYSCSLSSSPATLRSRLMNVLEAVLLKSLGSLRLFGQSVPPARVSLSDGEVLLQCPGSLRCVSLTLWRLASSHRLPPRYSRNTLGSLWPSARNLLLEKKCREKEVFLLRCVSLQCVQLRNCVAGIREPGRYNGSWEL